MIIKKNNNIIFYKIFNKSKSRSIILISFIIYTVFIILTGAILQRIGVFSGYLKHITSTTDKISNLSNYINGKLYSDYENIIINIKYKNYSLLEDKRKQALEYGFLISTSYDYVKATITVNDKRVKAKIRLKGDELYHLLSDKWSFRIKVEGDNTFMGMKVFSLHHPEERNYLNEWLYHRALKREGVLSLRYKFLNVVLNGKDLGIYALEEHFDKRLIEHNMLKNGPILKFSEDNIWPEMADYGGINPKAYELSTITAFKSKSIMADPLLRKNFIKAKNLLEGFRSRILKTRDVFDLDKISKYFAITDLVGAGHGTSWGNERYYYNSITSKLEPIGFDGDTGDSNGSPRIIFGGVEEHVGQYIYLNTYYQDELFIKKYIQELNRVSEEDYLNSLLNDLEDDIKKNMYIIHSEYPSVILSKEDLIKNQHKIKSTLNPQKAIHAYINKVINNEIILDVGNLQQLPIEILYIMYKDKIKLKPIGDNLLKFNLKYLPIDYKKIRFSNHKYLELNSNNYIDYKIYYRIVGLNSIKNEIVYPGPSFDNELISNDVFISNNNFKEFSYLSVDETAKKIVIARGKWVVTKNIIIPDGYILYAGPGVELSFTNSAKLISFSTIKFIGSEDYPIIISSDSSGQGLAVLNAVNESVLRNVHFINLAAPNQDDWALSGSVTFYQSDVRMSHCIFRSSRSEDSLNIIRSNFILDNSIFAQSKLDAFDADFSTGQINNTHFIDSGNDAMDFAGSEVNINNVNVNKAGDKGISSGEGSFIKLHHSVIKNTDIGIASKDSSIISSNDIILSENNIGISVFQKKSEYGPGTYKGYSIIIQKTGTPYLVEKNSTLIINDETIPPNYSDVKKMIYENQK